VANWLAEIVAAGTNRGKDFTLRSGDKLSLLAKESQVIGSRADDFSGHSQLETLPHDKLIPAESNSLLSLADDPAGDPRRCNAGGFSAHRMDYQRGPAIAEDRMSVRSQRDVWRNH
jgi:hypothetical protein